MVAVARDVAGPWRSTSRAVRGGARSGTVRARTGRVDAARDSGCSHPVGGPGRRWRPATRQTPGAVRDEKHEPSDQPRDDRIGWTPSHSPERSTRQRIERDELIPLVGDLSLGAVRRTPTHTPTEDTGPTGARRPSTGHRPHTHTYRQSRHPPPHRRRHGDHTPAGRTTPTSGSTTRTNRNGAPPTEGSPPARGHNAQSPARRNNTTAGASGECGVGAAHGRGTPSWGVGGASARMPSPPPSYPTHPNSEVGGVGGVVGAPRVRAWGVTAPVWGGGGVASEWGVGVSAVCGGGVACGGRCPHVVSA